MRVIVDLHGGEPNDFVAQAEFQEIKDKVMYEVSVESYGHYQASYHVGQRELGEGRSYATMWRKYKRRVLLAMSSQAFAQLVRTLPFLRVKYDVCFGRSYRMGSMVCCRFFVSRFY